MYKGVNPTCHDFNKVTMTNNSVSLLVGLSSGQIQLIDPIRRDSCRIYNEEVSSFLLQSDLLKLI